MAQAYLDKAGMDGRAETLLENVSLNENDLLNLSGMENGVDVVLAQVMGFDDVYCFFCDPETQYQKDRLEEICIEAGLRFEVEADVYSDLPEEERIPPKWTVQMPGKHWKKLTCLFMREVFRTEDFTASLDS